MKLIGALLFCIFSLTVFAQNKDEQEILSILDAQTKAWNTGKIDAFMQGYWQSDSLMFIGANGITYGYAATLANYHKRYPDLETMGKLTFTIIKVSRIASDAYFVTGKYDLKREIKGDVSGYFTLLWRKKNGAWVIVADHSS